MMLFCFLRPSSGLTFTWLIFDVRPRSHRSVRNNEDQGGFQIFFSDGRHVCACPGPLNEMNPVFSKVSRLPGEPLIKECSMRHSVISFYINLMKTSDYEDVDQYHHDLGIRGLL